MSIDSADDVPLDLVVDEVYWLKDRGTAVICRRRSGEVRAGDTVDVAVPDGESRQVLVRGLGFGSIAAHKEGTIELLLGPEADHFVVSGAVIRGTRVR